MGNCLCSGDRLDASGDINHKQSPMDYFYLSFPIEQTNLTIHLMNIRLSVKHKKRIGQERTLQVLESDEAHYTV